jgi:hypothetical protein
MHTNFLALAMSNKRCAEFEAALDSMEAALTTLTLVEGDERGRMGWLGSTSELFCRQVVDALDLHSDVLPEDLDPEDIREQVEADLKALERLHQHRDRMQLLIKRADDALAAAGSDIMETAMIGYTLLAAEGKGAGVTALSKRRRRSS